MLVTAVVVVGCAPTLRYLGYLPELGSREVTMQWQVAHIAADRRSAVIRVDTCHSRFDGARATKVGRDVRLTVFVRQEQRAGKVSCAPLSRMPTRVVEFGFVLPAGGRVVGEGYALRVVPPG